MSANITKIVHTARIFKNLFTFYDNDVVKTIDISVYISTYKADYKQTFAKVAVKADNRKTNNRKCIKVTKAYNGENYKILIKYIITV